MTVITIDETLDPKYPAPKGLGRGSKLSTAELNEAFGAANERTQYLRRRGICDWDAALTYAAQDVIQHASVLYTAIASNNNKRPPDNPDVWKPWAVTKDQIQQALDLDRKLNERAPKSHTHPALTSAQNNFTAQLQDDGNCVIRDSQGRVVWHSSNTYQRPEAESRFLSKDRFDKKLYSSGGDWAGYDVEHPVEGKNTYFNGWIAGVTKGGMEIVHTGGGRYVLNFTATPAGAATTDRRAVALQVANDATSVLGQLRVKPGLLSDGAGLSANNGDTDTGIEFPWADGGMRFKRDGQIPLAFEPNGTTTFQLNDTKVKLALQSDGNTVWYKADGSVGAVVWSDGGIHTDKQVYAKNYVHAEQEVLSNNLRAKQTLVLNGRTAQSKEIHVYTNEGADMRVHNITANRQMMQLNSDGNLHTATYGWLHEFFARRNEFGNSLAENGYQKIAGGLIVQWGAVTWGDAHGSNYTKSCTLPIPFPNATLHVFPSIKDNASSGNAGATATPSVRALTKDGFAVVLNEYAGITQNITVSWFAVGF